MSTLKEAVESGRRWRWTGGDFPSEWYGPGHIWHRSFGTREALSSHFEIEPEPEKPREWVVHVDPTGIYPHGDLCVQGTSLIRVHDADACDRLHATKASQTDQGYSGTRRF